MEATWKDRFVDARFDQFEATAWEELVGAGLGRDEATAEMLRRREAALNLPPCNYCGSLAWTVRNYGRVTHKQACPHRTDPWHQGEPEGETDG